MNQVTLINLIHEPSQKIKLINSVTLQAQNKQ